jgi:cobalt-zinc-cadmium efflux system outer membrane protein
VAQSSAPSRAAVPVELSLRDAASRALAKNLDLRVARADTGFALAQLIGARLRPNPSLAVQTQTTGQTDAGRPEGATSISFTQELQLWGLRDNRMREATLEQQRAFYAIRDAERLVQREVAATYRELVFQRQRVAFLDSLARLNGRIARVAELAFQQALGSELDARISDASTHQALLDRDRALREYDIGRLQFARLLGDSLDTVYSLSDSLPPAALRFLVLRTAAAAAPEASVQFDLSQTGSDSLIRLALAGRPDVRAAEYAVQVSAASLTVARSVARPTVAVGGLLSRTRDNFSLGSQQGTSLRQEVGVGVVIGLPFNNRNQGEIARAEFAGASAALRLANVRLTVERDVRVAAARVALAASQVETFRQTILPTSTAALRLAEAAFGRGQVSIFQVLQVQRTYVESSTGLLESFRQYAAALADLEAAVGQPVQ